MASTAWLCWKPPLYPHLHPQKTAPTHQPSWLEQPLPLLRLQALRQHSGFMTCEEAFIPPLALPGSDTELKVMEAASSWVMHRAKRTSDLHPAEGTSAPSHLGILWGITRANQAELREVSAHEDAP